MKIPASIKRSSAGHVYRSVRKLLLSDEGLVEWAGGPENFFRSPAAFPFKNAAPNHFVVAPSEVVTDKKPGRILLTITVEVVVAFEELQEALRQDESGIEDILDHIRRLAFSDTDLSRSNGGEPVARRFNGALTVDQAVEEFESGVQGFVTLGLQYEVEVDKDTWENLS